jgi:hypothetical protein
VTPSRTAIEGLFVCALAFVGVVVAAEATTALERLGKFSTAAREARSHQDWAAYRAAAEQIKGLLNASPQSRLEVARAQVHVGNETAALDELTAYARMGQASEVVEKLPDFAPLRDRKGFEPVRASMAANRQPVAHSTAAFHIADPGLLPEDIDFDPQSKRFFFSSILQRRIVSTAGEGPLVELAKSPSGWPILALKIDAKRQVLWATEVAISGFASVPETDRGRSAVLSYDLKTGKLLRRIEGPRPSALGDMALAANGSVIVSDGEHGGLYRLEPGKDQLERLDRGDFISPQTLVIAPDAAHLYVPDYVRGLGMLDLKTKEVRWLSTADRFALDGIDGLYRVGNQFIAIQNGTNPDRVVQFSTDAATTEIRAENLVERATPTLGDPTHGVIVGDTFYYIANSGWDALNADGSVKSGVAMTQALVMKWPLPRR